MKSILKNIVFITLPAIILVFLIVEIGVRLATDHIDLMQLTGQKDVENPMSQWADIDAFSAYTAKPQDNLDGKTVNSLGFISTPEINLKKPEETLRIVFLGGSSTAGTGFNLPDTATWPWKVIEQLKQETGKNIDFINAALGGYSTFESYGRLWSRIRFFNPDIIILYHGWNDMYFFTDEFAENPLWWRVKRARFGEVWGVDKPIRYAIVNPHPIDNYISWSQILVRLRRRLADQNKFGELRNYKSDSLNSEFNKNGVAIFHDNLLLIKTFASTFDIDLYVCKQATLISESNTKEERGLIGYEAHGFDHNAHLAAFAAIYASIDSLFTPSQIIDLTQLSGKSDLFHDHIHPTNIGTSRIADIVANSITGNLLQ